jgi:hypothetical protein
MHRPAGDVAVPPAAAARIRSGEESVLCSTALLRRGLTRAYFARPPCCALLHQRRLLPTQKLISIRAPSSVALRAGAVPPGWRTC